MVSSGAARTTRTGLRWFVRVVAVLVGLANLSVVILWFVGGLYTLAGDGASLREALPSVLVTLIASVATSEIVLRVFELPGRSFTHRYKTVVMSMCLGGMVMGALLSVLYAIDGTMGADPSREFYADLLNLRFNCSGTKRRHEVASRT
jgi:predicted Abi (CAAX) family protease